jgi:hypothetical protein
MRFSTTSASRNWLATLAFALLAGAPLIASEVPVAGPLDVRCSGSGPGLTHWFDGMAPIDPEAAWSMMCWVKTDGQNQAYTLIAGFGDGVEIGGAERFFALYPNGVHFWSAESDVEMGPAPDPGRWQHLAATWDGLVLSLYRDGAAVGKPKRMSFTRCAALAKVAPPSPWLRGRCFAGQVARFAVYDRCLDQSSIAELGKSSEGLERLVFTPTPGGATPEVALLIPVRGQRGLQSLQDSATIPAPPAMPVPKGKPSAHPSAPNPQPDGDGGLLLRGGWRMADGTTVTSTPGEICAPGFDAGSWWNATVPGTALTTLVDQGVYPDPLHGRNNLSIPDDLARRNWWYRVPVAVPAAAANRSVWLTFNGINYHAEAWLNGIRLGEMTGAFTRGTFDVTAALRKDGANILAVRVWPPPHPGHPHEQSFLAGDGPNGGDQTFDGPTFFCTEGWDWIPGIRDRCTGIWQDVVLRHSGGAVIADPQVITELPLLPDTSRADITIRTEVRNVGVGEEKVVLSGEIGDISFAIGATLAPGERRTLSVSPAQFPQLGMSKPRLWWPNGYGEPALYDLRLQLNDDKGRLLDSRQLRFGVRTLSYEFDPHLVVKVNGRRILCKGGNWGMDDALKRVSRERLEPYVRMHRDANLTMIRNWCGQSTEETFFQLCDEYGLMVWNEFWMTTDGWNVDPLDAEVMLDNVSDTVRRFRNHPCIALWCGRNEGVPPPRINERLAHVLEDLDGTRHYQANSRDLHLLNSGPWSYIDPVRYYTERAKGFSSELGLHSVPSVEAVRAMLDGADQWPPNDAWAYHDLHITGNGDAHGYLNAISGGYNGAASLDEFCRRAQMVNYVNYRAMFEAWNAHLWKPCSGLLIWMSHPSWPSMAWQLYAQDYEANGSLFGVKKACEPLHIQLNLPDDGVQVINHRFDNLEKIGISAVVVSLDGRRLWEKSQVVDAAPSACTGVFSVQWPDEPTSPVEFLRLEMRSQRGELISDNFYWHSPQFSDQRFLARLTKAPVQLQLTSEDDKGWKRLHVRIANPGRQVALMIQLTPVGADGQRILPAYASDNFISLLPGEERNVVIEVERDRAPSGTALRVEGWNVDRQLVH